MNNQIYDLNDSFDFSVINLGNPSLLNNNNYFSKISQGSVKKNLYVQFPKCITKQGLIKGNNKSYCELNFSITEKTVIEFLENLEKHCLNEIYKNKELWFYNSDSMTYNDIEELMTPVIKTYKHGKNFLVKNIIKQDKFNIYDENENKINFEDYDNSHEFIPLININGIKFSSKNFTIEIILTQMMVLYPSDEFEKQILIKVNNDNKKTINNKTDESLGKNLEKNLETEDNNSNNSLESTNNILETIENNENNENIEENVQKTLLDTVGDTIEDNVGDNVEDTIKDTKEATVEANVEDTIKEDKKNNDQFKYLTNVELEPVNNFDLSESNDNDPISIKSRDEIYLEIYKKAKQKAKEIRKNAIEAFLEAKNIKAKYNLESLVNSDSSDDEDDIEAEV